MKRLKFAGVNFPSRSTLKWLNSFYRAKRYSLKNPKNIEDLVNNHFKFWSTQTDNTKEGFYIALKSISYPSLIIETGTSAWGCDSSRLFDSFVKKFGGEFHSVDLRVEASLWLQYQVSNRTKFHVKDSVEFLNLDLPKLISRKIDLLYLDSFDLDWSNPMPSAKHCLEEFNGALPFLSSGSYVLIDDTPEDLKRIPVEFHDEAIKFKKEYDQLPGKGSLVLNEIKTYKNMKVVYHTQNVLIQIN